MKYAIVAVSAVLLTLLSVYLVTNEELVERFSGVPKSTAVIQILPTSPVLADPAMTTDNFIDNEVASLSMGEVFKRAALLGEWSGRGVDLKSVRDSYEVTRIEGTDLVRITAYPTAMSVTPKELIDGLIQAYIEIRNNSEIDISYRNLKALDDELIAQSDLVQDNREDLTVLIQQYGIPYFEGHSNLVGQSEMEIFAGAQEKFHSFEAELILQEAKLASVEKGSEQYEDLSRKVNELTKQKELLQKWIDDLRNDNINLSLRQSQYNQAKEDYEASKALLRKMRVQQQEARVAVKMPKTILIVREKPE